MMFEDFMQCFSKENVELMVITARCIWLRRNSLIFDWEFRHLYDVFDGAIAAWEDFQRCNNPDLSQMDRNDGLSLARQQRWQPPPNVLIKVT